jgi:ribonuclease HI
LKYAARLDYSDPSDRCTNNTTEYEALLLGLRKVRALGASNWLVKCDAEVIKDHVEKESEAKESELIKYLVEVRKMERHFQGFTIEHLPRKRNGEADELAKKVARGEAMPPDVFFEILTAPCIRPDKQPLSTVNATANLDWRAPIIAFLHGCYDLVETHELKRDACLSEGLCSQEGQPIQVRGMCTVIEVHHSRTTHRAYERISWWNVWIPYSSESFRWKSFQVRFLLANGNKRRRADRQNMQSLPIHSKAPTKARGSITTHHSYLPVTALGDGHRRTITYSSRQFQFHRGSS